MKYQNGTVKYYKGYGIVKYHGEWEAAAYANPTFNHTNLAEIKKLINQYLRS